MKDDFLHRRGTSLEKNYNLIELLDCFFFFFFFVAWNHSFHSGNAEDICDVVEFKLR